MFRFKKNIMTKVLISIAIVIIAFVTINFEGCKKKPTKIDKVSIRLAWITQSQFAGLYVAKEKEYFKKNGIDCEIYPGGVDFNSVKLVASGSDHFGLAGSDALIVARAKEIPLVGIAAIMQKNPACFFALKESGITKPQDFTGKKVGILVGKTLDLMFHAMIKKLGIGTKKIETIPVQFNMAPFFERKVDVWPGYILNEPITAQEKGFEINIIYPGDYGIHLYGDVLFCQEKLIKENPDLVRRFLDATIKGWKWTIEHPEEAVDIVMKYNDKLNKEHEIKMMAEMIKLVNTGDALEHGIGWMDSTKWAETQQILLDGKAIEKSVPPSDLFTNRFLAEIYKKP